MRIAISLPKEQHIWLKDHPWIKPSSLLQEAVSKMMTGEVDRERIRYEIVARLKNADLKNRPRVVIDDVRHSLGPAYPIEEIDYIVNTVIDLDKKMPASGEMPGEMTKEHPVSRGMEFLRIKFYRVKQKYNEPIIEFRSQLR